MKKESYKKVPKIKQILLKEREEKKEEKPLKRKIQPVSRRITKE